MDESLLKTPLYDLHLELGAKLVPFAGYSMPVQYPEGVINEHMHVRKQAGLFDVSHMGQIMIWGDGAAQALENLLPVLPVDLCRLNYYQLIYTVLTNEQGGILDDLIVARWSDNLFFLVVNAANKEKDLEHLRHHIHKSITVKSLPDRALLSLQGPAARDVIKNIAPKADQLVYMTGGFIQIDEVNCYITCSGYTGEDGFEISIPAYKADAIARRLLEDPKVKPIGLGARDSLRLEAGLCLHGYDINEETTPVEANLSWVIAKSYHHENLVRPLFPGAEKILRQKRYGPGKLRVGLSPEGKIPVRGNTIILNSEGEEVGIVTSGGYGATIGRPISMGYVHKRYSKPGTKLWVEIRDKSYVLRVTKLPFIKHRYFKPKR